MRTTFDLEQILYDRLKNGDLVAEITGGLYKRQRVPASELEDVVIISLPINADQIQEGIVNINIHVPNIEVTANGVTNPDQPDTARLMELADLAKLELDDVYEPTTGYFFNIQQQQLFSDEEAKDHYINFRIVFNSLNL